MNYPTIKTFLFILIIMNQYHDKQLKYLGIIVDDVEVEASFRKVDNTTFIIKWKLDQYEKQHQQHFSNRICLFCSFKFLSNLLNT